MRFGDCETAPLQRGVLLLLVCGLLPHTALALDSTAPESLNPFGASAVDIPIASTVGPLRAGKLCLPNGKVRVRDFVSGQSAFGVMVKEALDGLDSDRRTHLSALNAPVSVHLVGIKAKLCARDWGAFGFGDRRALAGEAAFTFELGTTHQGAAPATRHEVSLKLKGADALPPPDILHLALVQLLSEAADDARPR
jgi:hypothetical protein